MNFNDSSFGNDSFSGFGSPSNSSTDIADELSNLLTIRDKKYAWDQNDDAQPSPSIVAYDDQKEKRLGTKPGSFSDKEKVR